MFAHTWDREWQANKTECSRAGGHCHPTALGRVWAPRGLPGPSLGSGRRDMPGASVIETLHGRPSETEAPVPSCGFKS